MPTPTFTVPVLVYVGLISQTTGVEIVQKGYTRRPALFNYLADGVSIANATTVQWTVATSPWGIITYVQVWDLPSGGASFGSFPALAPNVFVDRGDIPRIQAGDIAITTAAAPRGFGTGGFGTFGFAGPTLARVLIGVAGGVPVEITFDDTGHVCAPGTWTMNPYFQRAA